jgi:hypothetical protein
MEVGAMAMLTLVAVFLVAVTMGLSLAHALEFPGKARLAEPTYRAVQAIYYPGFTIGGLIGEFGALIVLPVLLALTPVGTEQFWWTAISLALLVLAHLTYWFVTHPVNGAWLKDTELAGAARVFFGTRSSTESNWVRMRNLWEFSHVARAVLAAASFVVLLVAVT